MAAAPMKIRATETGGVVDVKVRMAHVMETGQRRNDAGKPIPAHFIQTVSVRHGDKVVLSAQWGTAVSKDPFLHFRFKGGKKGDKVTISWRDSAGDTRTDEATVG